MKRVSSRQDFSVIFKVAKIVETCYKSSEFTVNTSVFRLFKDLKVEFTGYLNLIIHNCDNFKSAFRGTIPPKTWKDSYEKAYDSPQYMFSRL